MEIAFATILGMGVGFLIGVLPGLGTTTMLILMFPFLMQQELLFCVIFYCVVSSTSQYFGNITALSFGIPGETTSFPLLEIREQVIKQNKISETQFLCAYGSLVSSIIAGILLLLSADFFQQHIFYLKSYVSLVCAAVGMGLCLLFSNNKILISFGLLCFGWMVGKVGYNEVHKTEFLTFGNLYLYSGIPALPATLGLYALPCLVKMYLELKKIPTAYIGYHTNFDKAGLGVTYLITIFRSSFIGFFSGLVPYIGNAVCSFLAFLVEKKLKPNDVTSHAVAAESSNNSSAISVLIPLLFLGVAIVPSEFVLLEIIYSSSNPFSWQTIFNSISVIIVCLIFSNLVSFVISWNMVNVVNKTVVTLKTFFPMLVVMLIVSGVAFTGLEYDQHVYYLTVLFMFFIVGLLLYKFDTLPFVYGYLLQSNVESILYKVITLYF